MHWVAEYERAWRYGDVSGVPRLFTESASYRISPYAEPTSRTPEIQAFWLDDEGRTFTVTAEPVAVEGRDAVVRLEVRYGDPVQEYRDLWVLRFAPDGRVEDFEEWAYWPGKPYSADAEAVEIMTTVVAEMTGGLGRHPSAVPSDIVLLRLPDVVTAERVMSCPEWRILPRAPRR